MATKAKDGKCACPGPICGDQTYGEMFETMKAVHMGQGQSIENLRQIHLKWKRIGAQVR